MQLLTSYRPIQSRDHARAFEAAVEMQTAIESLRVVEDLCDDEGVCNRLLPIIKECEFIDRQLGRQAGMNAA